MAIKKEKKVELVKSIVDKVGKSSGSVLVGFTKLQAKDAIAMRKFFKEKGVGFTVSKKTLLKRALGDLKIEGNVPDMEGQVAIAYGSDAIMPAQAMGETVKKYKDVISIFGGILEGRFISPSEVMTLSMIPSREVLLSQFLNVLNGPIQGFVGTLNAVMRDFVLTLDQVAKSKQA